VEIKSLIMSQSKPVKVIGIRRFDLNKLPAHGLAVNVGKRGTGKTSMEMYLSRHSPRAKTAIWIVMAGSEPVKQAWRKLVHPMFVMDPSIEYLEKLRAQQNKLAEKYPEDGEVPYPEELEIELIIDDCGTLRWFMHSEILKWWAANGRHLHVNIRVMLQYIYMSPTDFRENIDSLRVQATGNLRNIQTLQREYVTCTSLREFTAILLQITSNRGTLFIDNGVNAQNVSDICYKFRLTKQDLADTTTLGSDKLRAWADKHSKENMMRELQKQRQEEGEEEDWVENDEEILREMADVSWEDCETTAYSDRFGRIIVRDLKQKND